MSHTASVRSLVFDGQIAAGDSAFISCPFDVEVWGSVQAWSASKTAPVSGVLSVGHGVYTQTSTSGTGGNGPNAVAAFLSLAFGNIAATELTSTLASFIGQVPSGLVMALNNTSNEALRARVWCTPRLVLTSEATRVHR